MFACLNAAGNSELLLKCAGHFSPLIEETSPDTVVFDVRGLGLICGTPEQIAGEILSRVGIPVNLAIGPNPDAVVHAARGRRGLTIFPAGREAEMLAPLPLYLLGGAPEFARTLDLWGIRTFGEFAALPPDGVASRMGDEGTGMQQLARGAGHRRLRLRADPPRFIEERELDDAVALLEPLLFLLAAMLDELCARLRFHGRSTNEIRLRLKLERGFNYMTPDHMTTLRLPVPILNPKVLLKLLHLELNDKPPPAPVEKIRLEAIPAESRTTQHGLFLPSTPEPERLEITLARLRALVGTGNVGAPEILDTHGADAFRLGPLTISPKTGPSARLRLALRRFRPPCPARVWCTGYGEPARVISTAAKGSVVAYAGPWRTSGDWWTGMVWDHEEWDVEIQDTGVSRIFRDYLNKQWFVAGNYD